ncbi:MAG: bifunctional DNA-formamidopyrimidine glycosylase/DNA-(apurinic or apyrimidinic site) lyase [Alphaproteobacteria bacterium]|nr:bifunctional DNA-formamidopyrimidine glycosylase/DNA-(apurinic or apyrimidinic site) lyase [Alphaproteobacteria bacterium]
MPELPEVETVCRGLAAKLEGHVLARVEARRTDLRRKLPANFARRLTGRRVLRIGRRAKYILMYLDDGDVLIAHLGMSGRMVLADSASAPLDRHDHVVFVTDAGQSIRYNDARRFGLMTLARANELENHELLAGIGPEPLGNEFNGPALAARLAGKATSIKAALLDQSVVAGIGNIYACEALFFAGLSPRRKASTVQGERADRLAAAIRDVLTRAIAAGGSSLRDHVQPSGELGYFQHAWAVYGRAGQPCPGCDCRGGVRRMVQSNRSTFYCAKRQR